MAETNESPAVLSLRKEQAQQNLESNKSHLDKGLEDTFPASDPVSVTHTAVTAGATSSDAEDRQQAVSENAAGYLRDIKDAIRERPIATVATVAALAFIFGATR